MTEHNDSDYYSPSEEEDECEEEEGEEVGGEEEEDVNETDDVGEDSQFANFLRDNLYLDPGNKYVRHDKEFLVLCKNIGKSDILKYPRVLNYWISIISKKEHPISEFLKEIGLDITHQLRGMQGGMAFFSPDDLMNDIRALPHLIIDKIVDQYTKGFKIDLKKEEFPLFLMTRSIQSRLLEHCGRDIFAALEKFDEAETEMKIQALRGARLKLRELPIRRILQLQGKTPYKKSINSIGRTIKCLNFPIEKQLQIFEESYYSIFDEIEEKVNIFVEPTESELLRIMMYVLIESPVGKLSALFRYIKMFLPKNYSRKADDSENIDSEGIALNVEYFEVFRQVFLWIQTLVEVDMTERRAKVDSKKLLQPTMIPVLSQQPTLPVLPKRRRISPMKRKEILKFSRKKFVQFVRENTDEELDSDLDSEYDDSDLELNEEEEKLEQERVEDEWKKNQERYSKLDLLVQMMEKKYKTKIIHGKTPFDYNIEHISKKSENSKDDKNGYSSGEDSDSLVDLKKKFKEYDVSGFGSGKKGDSENFGSFKNINYNEDVESQDGDNDSGDDWDEMSSGYSNNNWGSSSIKTGKKEKKEKDAFASKWENDSEQWDEESVGGKDGEDHKKNQVGGMDKKKFGDIKSKLSGMLGGGGDVEVKKSRKWVSKKKETGIKPGNLNKLKIQLAEGRKDSESEEEPDVEDDALKKELEQLKGLGSISKMKDSLFSNNRNKWKNKTVDKDLENLRSRKFDQSNNSSGVGKSRFEELQNKLMSSSQFGGGGSKNKSKKVDSMSGGVGKSKFAELQKKLMSSRQFGGGSSNSKNSKVAESTGVGRNKFSELQKALSQNLSGSGNDGNSEVVDDDESDEYLDDSDSDDNDEPPPPPPPDSDDVFGGKSDSASDQEVNTPQKIKNNVVFFNKNFARNKGFGTTKQEVQSEEDSEESESESEEDTQEPESKPKISGIFINKNFRRN